jgi:hypothetical protein
MIRFVVTPGRRTRLAALCVFSVLLLTPATAGAYIYWFHTSWIARATIAGRHVEPNFIHAGNGSVSAIAVSSRYLYFGGSDGAVARVSLAGRGMRPLLFRIPQPVGSLEWDVDGLAAAGHFVYWSSYGEWIGRATEQGTEVDPQFIYTGGHSYSATIAGDHIYWLTSTAVGRATLNGTDVEPGFIRLHQLPVHADEAEEDLVAEAGEIPLRGTTSTAIAVGDGHIFWTEKLAQGIGRARTDGLRVQPHFLPNLGYGGGIAVGAGHLYWRSEVAPLARVGWIAEAPVTGGAWHRLIRADNDLNGGITIDMSEPRSERRPKAKPVR